MLPISQKYVALSVYLFWINRISVIKKNSMFYKVYW